MTAAQIRVVQLKLKFYIFMHARCRFVRIFQLVIVHVFQMYSCMTIECIPSSSRVGRVRSSLLAKMMERRARGWLGHPRMIVPVTCPPPCFSREFRLKSYAEKLSRGARGAASLNCCYSVDNSLVLCSLLHYQV